MKHRGITLNIAGAVKHYDEFVKKLPVFKLMNKIDISVYDGPNLCHWNGGRINRNIVLTDEMIDRYNSYAIPVTLTFTNHKIDLEDEEGLRLLKILRRYGKKYNVKNRIVLVNEDLRVFLRTRYNFDLIYSITGHPSSIELSDDVIMYYKDLETKYDYIVPKFEHVFNETFYENVDTSKYELLINDTCVYGCPHYHEHFKAIADQNANDNPWVNLGEKVCTEIEECWLPNFNPDVGSYKDKEKYGEKLGMDFTRDMIKKAISLGYRSFKISGRENSTKMIMSEIERFLSDIK